MTSSRSAMQGGDAATAPVRPAVSLITPFAGDREAARELLDRLACVALKAGDELIVADNSADGVVAELAAGTEVTVVVVDHQRSSYAARNAGAELAVAPWLLFVDADCVASAGLVEAYFSPPPGERSAAAVGEVVALGGQTALLARYSRSRGLLGQARHLEHPYLPFGATANLLVRRDAWREIGGFQEGIISSADAELCWRLQDAGWTIEPRLGAIVAHRHREQLRPLVAQALKYGAGVAWLNRRYPGSFPRPRLARALARCAAGIVVWGVLGRRERAQFKAIDAVWLSAQAVGSLRGNRAPLMPARAVAPTPPQPLAIVVMTDLFPALSETFIAAEVRALLADGHRVRIEASARPPRPQRGGAAGLAVSYLEDDGIMRRLLDLLWLASRHPRDVLADLRERRRWSGQERVWPMRALAPVVRRLTRSRERHIHVHFAGPAGLNALRIARITGASYSLTAHAYDIYQRPANLREKLVGAAAVTSGCLYTVEDLRALLGPGQRDKVQEIVMGVDVNHFRRSSARWTGRRVISVGRLVEKKGFGHLLDAAGLLASEAPLDRLEIIGDGPLRAELERRVRDLGIQSTVSLVGWRDPDDVRELVERADLLAMPCVVAADGDRDSMPLVVKEALALEVPVVVTDEVGLPELVQQGWGRLVPPGDARALAEAIAELLALPEETRAAMGTAGRAWVAEHCNTTLETRKLAELIARAAPAAVRP